MSSCRNPNCTNYSPTCTNYSYVCPSCTNCCKDMVYADCVKYRGNNLACLTVTKNDTLDVILTKLNTVLCDSLSETYNIQCLGGASNATLTETIQAIIDDICAVSTNLFDLSCLEADNSKVDLSINQAMSYLVTYVCAATGTFLNFDTVCLGGTSSDNLEDTINLLITKACDGPTFTLDWDDLVPPSDITDTPLSDILDSIVDNLRCEKITFDADQFNVTTNANCTKEVELDIPEVSQQILDNIEITPDQITQLRDMGLAKMFANESCAKESIEEKLIFSPKFDAKELLLNPHAYVLTLGNGGSQNTFLGIKMPNGIYKEQTFLLSNTTGLQTWLNGLNVGTFVVTAYVGYITIAVTTEGDLTSYYPIVTWKNTSSSTTLLYSTFTGSQSSASQCEILSIDIKEPNAWTNVDYSNLWSGTIKYRYNIINNTVEIRPGYITKLINPSYTSSLSEVAFTIPSYNSDGTAVWNPHGILVNTCVTETDCVLNCRLRLPDNSTSFYVDINDCVRSESTCNPGDVVTISLEPSFYYVV